MSAGRVLSDELDDGKTTVGFAKMGTVADGDSEGRISGKIRHLVLVVWPAVFSGS